MVATCGVTLSSRSYIYTDRLPLARTVQLLVTPAYLWQMMVPQNTSTTEFVLSEFARRLILRLTPPEPALKFQQGTEG